jgi:Predicted transmembrane transcriptional regulator (anti-sigma factor)
MRCSNAARQLQLYIDERLTFDQIRALEAHLADCPTCRADLFLLEEVSAALHKIELVAEPADLAENVMRRVAQVQQQSALRAAMSIAEKTQRQKEPFFSFRPSLPELIVAIVLATLTLLALVIEQPAVRATLGLTVLLDSHNSLILFVLSCWNMLMSVNSDALMVCLWILGTILGVWITLIVAGADMRNQWFRAVMDRLPVHL